MDILGLPGRCIIGSKFPYVVATQFERDNVNQMFVVAMAHINWKLRKKPNQGIMDVFFSQELQRLQTVGVRVGA